MNILFLCTHNRCRSILAEALFNHLATSEHRAHSAGSDPSGVVHPRSLALLQAKGVSTEGLYSKPWDEHAQLQPELVITVCDDAAGEACPVFLGGALKVHWGMADPSRVQGPEAEILAAFEAAHQTLTERITRLLTVLAKEPSNSELTKILTTLEAR